MNVHGVVGYGPIVASNEVVDLVVIFDGAHLKLYRRQDADYRFVETRHLCEHLEDPCRWKVTVGAAEELGKMWIEELCRERGWR